MKTTILRFVRVTLYCFSFFIWTESRSQDITTCSNPEGVAYYHHFGAVNSKDSGWSSDKISNGKLTLKKISSKEFDILILDATNSIFSLKQDGGELIFMRAGESDATFLHFYPGKVIEIYTFWRDSNGKFKYDLVQSKGGSATPVHKSSILVGECTPINFDMLR